eukprot:TRINITY_DN5469_c0_g5_i1.p1 TRINITY_DN5469_c0_g5~~TRINITY_DN5469_c0_g5_i1.p1  ORF type:complete len:504 (+),score=163.88 TRINITY_DN5469_c0_g5_i1:850-2361(+)
MKENRGENYCECNKRKLIVSYCQLCKVYMCPDCTIIKHFGHDNEIVDLAEKCSRCLADYRRLFHLALVMADRRQVHIKKESMGSIIGGLEEKVANVKKDLQSDIDKSNKASFKIMEKCPLIREMVERKAELTEKPNDPLSKIRTELKATCKTLLSYIADDSLESADKFISEGSLKDCEERVRRISKEAGKDIDFIHELQKLKRTQVNYSYDPMAIMGMLSVTTTITKPDRILQFDRQKNAVIFFDINLRKAATTVVSSEFIMPFRFVSIETGRQIYLSGGDNDHGQYLKSLHLYDEIRGGFVPLAEMRVGRSRHALVAIEDQELIYAIGGETEEGITRICELYDVKTNVWREGARLTEARCGLGGCSVEGRVYAIGGWNKYCLDTIECLEAGGKEWAAVKVSRKHNALEPVQFPGVAVKESGDVLIFGGYKEGEELSKETFIFDIKANRIEKAEELKEPEAFLSSETKRMGGKVYSFGYMKGGVHVFDEAKNEWTYLTLKQLL